MSMRCQRIVALALGGLVTVSAAVAPAAAQGLLRAPTHPTWAGWIGLQPETEFVLGGGRGQLQIGSFQEPRRVHICVTSGTTPTSHNVGARVVADDSQSVVPVGRCGTVEGKHIVVEPARPLGGDKRVKGAYSIAS